MNVLIFLNESVACILVQDSLEDLAFRIYILQELVNVGLLACRVDDGLEGAVLFTPLQVV